ncbi:hypothetical protein QUF80_20180 [Desulfococcaceae bacterium HSG8]|nr:hypothetical protein [Desulfococcaceae bacterium HSG8]
MSELIIEREKCLSFSKTLENRGLSAFLKIPLLTFIMLIDSLRGLYLLKKIRLFLNRCDKDCPNLKCLKNENIKIVRDNYINFSEKISEIPVMNFFAGWLVRRTLIGWDDLVEDMTIASDNEFRKLIMEKVT